MLLDLSNKGCDFCGFVFVPHVMEPTYPGMIGHYINLSAYYDRKKLKPQAEKMIELKKDYKACYTRAYQCFRAAKEVRRNGEKEFLTPAANAKLTKRANGILSREVKRKKESRGTVKKRFLGAVTCQGNLCLYETIQCQCKRVYELQDTCGLASKMLQELQEGIIKAGYDIIAFPSPEDPSRLDHIMIPELSLAFVTTLPRQALEKRPYRRIRIESMADKEVVKTNRAKLRFAYRVADELVEDGIRELKKAKEMHDEMEELYHSYVDFAGVNTVTNAIIEEILQLP